MMKKVFLLLTFIASLYANAQQDTLSIFGIGPNNRMIKLNADTNHLIVPQKVGSVMQFGLNFNGIINGRTPNDPMAVAQKIDIPNGLNATLLLGNTTINSITQNLSTSHISNSNKWMLGIGNSHMYGQNATVPASQKDIFDFIGQTATALGVQLDSVTNLGIQGYVINQSVPNQTYPAYNNRCRAVLLYWGINEMVAGMDTATYAGWYQQDIQKLRNLGYPDSILYIVQTASAYTLPGLYPWAATDSTVHLRNPLTKFVPNYYAYQALDVSGSVLTGSDQHPNSSGYKFMSNNILNVMNSADIAPTFIAQSMAVPQGAVEGRPWICNDIFGNGYWGTSAGSAFDTISVNNYIHMPATFSTFPTNPTGFLITRFNNHTSMSSYDGSGNATPLYLQGDNGGNIILSGTTTATDIAANSASLKITNPALMPFVVTRLAGQTGNMSMWFDENNHMLTKIDTAGNFTTQNIVAKSLSLQVANPAYVPLVVQKVASQTGDLTNWRDENNATIAKVTAIGGAVFTSIGSTNLASGSNAVAGLDAGGNIKPLAVGSNLTTDGTTFNLATDIALHSISLQVTNTGYTPFVLKRIAGQTGNFMNVLDQNNNSIAAITASGQGAFNALSATNLAGTGTRPLTVDPSGNLTVGTATTVLNFENVATGQTSTNSYSYTVSSSTNKYVWVGCDLQINSGSGSAIYTITWHDPSNNSHTYTQYGHTSGSATLSIANGSSNENFPVIHFPCYAGSLLTITVTVTGTINYDRRFYGEEKGTVQ